MRLCISDCVVYIKTITYCFALRPAYNAAVSRPHHLCTLQDDLVINDIKYHVKVNRRGPILFNVSLNDSNVDVLARKLGDGGFLLQVRRLVPAAWLREWL